MDHERVLGANHDLLREVGWRIPQIDRRGPVVVKDPEGVAQSQVDAGGLDEAGIPGVDPDLAVLHQLQDRRVGQDRDRLAVHQRKSASGGGMSALDRPGIVRGFCSLCATVTG